MKNVKIHLKKDLNNKPVLLVQKVIMKFCLMTNQMVTAIVRISSVPADEPNGTDNI